MIVSLDIGSEPTARVSESASRDHPFVLKLASKHDRVEIHLPQGALTAVFSALRVFFATADAAPSTTLAIEQGLVAHTAGERARQTEIASSHPSDITDLFLNWLRTTEFIASAIHNQAIHDHLWRAFVYGYLDRDRPRPI